MQRTPPSVTRSWSPAAAVHAAGRGPDEAGTADAQGRVNVATGALRRRKPPPRICGPGASFGAPCPLGSATAGRRSPGPASATAAPRPRRSQRELAS